MEVAEVFAWYRQGFEEFVLLTLLFFIFGAVFGGQTGFPIWRVFVENRAVVADNNTVGVRTIFRWRQFIDVSGVEKR